MGDGPMDAERKLTAGAREAEPQPSAIAVTTLGKPSLAASLALHTGLLLILVLLALWRPALPEPPVLKVTLLNYGPGAAGATGGSGGGAEASTAPAAESSAAPTSESSAASAQPPQAPTPPAPEPTAEAPAAAAPSAALAEAPAPALPSPPRAKPAPPRPRDALPAPAAPASAPQQLAAAPVEAAPGTEGRGGGPGGAVGRGSGAEGAGQGAIGNGPIEGPGDDYLDRLRRWLNKYKRYPEAAQKAKQQGHLVIGFTILRDGTLVDPRVEQSSGFPLLDAAALKMLRDASPVPPLPERYRAERLAVDLPVEFSIGLFDRLF